MYRHNTIYEQFGVNGKGVAFAFCPVFKGGCETGGGGLNQCRIEVKSIWREEEELESRKREWGGDGIARCTVPDPGVWFIRIDSGHSSSSRMYSCGGGSFPPPLPPPPPPAEGDEGGEAGVTWARQKLVGSSRLRPYLSSISRTT